MITIYTHIYSVNEIILSKSIKQLNQQILINNLYYQIIFNNNNNNKNYIII